MKDINLFKWAFGTTANKDLLERKVDVRLVSQATSETKKFSDTFLKSISPVFERALSSGFMEAQSGKLSLVATPNALSYLEKVQNSRQKNAPVPAIAPEDLADIMSMAAMYDMKDVAEDILQTFSTAIREGRATPQDCLQQLATFDGLAGPISRKFFMGLAQHLDSRGAMAAVICAVGARSATQELELSSSQFDRVVEIFLDSDGSSETVAARACALGNIAGVLDAEQAGKAWDFVMPIASNQYVGRGFLNRIPTAPGCELSARALTNRLKSENALEPRLEGVLQQKQAQHGGSLTLENQTALLVSFLDGDARERTFTKYLSYLSPEIGLAPYFNSLLFVVSHASASEAARIWEAATEHGVKDTQLVSDHLTTAFDQHVLAELFNKLPPSAAKQAPLKLIGAISATLLEARYPVSPSQADHLSLMVNLLSGRCRGLTNKKRNQAIDLFFRAEKLFVQNSTSSMAAQRALLKHAPYVGPQIMFESLKESLKREVDALRPPGRIDFVLEKIDPLMRRLAGAGLISHVLSDIFPIEPHLDLHVDLEIIHSAVPHLDKNKMAEVFAQLMQVAESPMRIEYLRCLGIDIVGNLAKQGAFPYRFSAYDFLIRQFKLNQHKVSGRAIRTLDGLMPLMGTERQWELLGVILTHPELAGSASSHDNFGKCVAKLLIRFGKPQDKKILDVPFSWILHGEGLAVSNGLEVFNQLASSADPRWLEHIASQSKTHWSEATEAQREPLMRLFRSLATIATGKDLQNIAGILFSELLRLENACAHEESVHRPYLYVIKAVDEMLCRTDGDHSEALWSALADCFQP
jgi:hypothetical protein